MSLELLDAHTFSLDSQGNIYTVTSITQHHSFTSKLLVATLNRKVFYLELSMSHCARPCGCVVVPQTQGTVQNLILQKILKFNEEIKFNSVSQIRF